MMYILQFDGMLQISNGEQATDIGLLGYGWIIRRNNMEVAHGFGVFMRKCMAGSNVAEYIALIEGLEALAELQIRDAVVEIRGDAKCVIDQMLGLAGVSSSLTQILHRRAQKLSRRFKSLTWVWVPRSENKQADKLSRRSFKYLQRSHHLDREINNARIIPLYGGRLLPLLDLRVHAPTSQACLV